jgi:hypothetical protein
MKIEIRENGVALEGYVNAVGRDSRILTDTNGQFVEQITPGVWQRALEVADDVALLFNHDKTRKLGSITGGNLELCEDNIGLKVKCTVTDPEVVEKAKTGKLQGWSFGFICTKSRQEAFNQISRRFIEGLKLLEVSVLDKTPAYYGTSIEMRDEGVEMYCLRSTQDPADDSIPKACVDQRLIYFKF